MASTGFNNDRDRVLEATNIVDLIGEQLRLVPKGREFVCLCPFHDDSKPSMYVVPHKQIYHCFACGAGGNALDFTMNYHAMGFVEALKHLAERAGIELTPWKGGGGSTGSEDASGLSKEQLQRANAFALSFFRAIFRHEQHGAVAREIAAKRGLSAEVIERFQIGASPDRFDGLLAAIQSKSLDPEPFAELGLLKRKETGGYYDALRNRLIFPILDQMNRPIAFGGRIINPEDTPKYLNSPETKLFHKSSTLYGMHAAFQAIKNSRVAIITEGYTDVIACHKAGFENVVATLGTALTPKHASILKRIVDTVVLLFDGDEAGQRAADRAIEVFFKEPIDVKIATVPGGKDPDDLLKEEGGAELFAEMIDAAEDAMAFRFERLESKLSASGALPGSEARSRTVEEELARLVDLGLNDLSPVRRQTMLKKLAAIARVEPRVMLEQADRLSRRRRPGPGRAVASENMADDSSGSSGEKTPTHPKTPADYALACLLLEPKLGALLRSRALSARGSSNSEDGIQGFSSNFPKDLLLLRESEAYCSDRVKRIARRLLEDIIPDAHTTGSAVLPDQVPDQLSLSCDDPDDRRTASALTVALSRELGGDPDRLIAQWCRCVEALRRNMVIAGSTPSGTGRRSGSGPSADAGEDDNSNFSGDPLEAYRRLHRELGGNPLAVPRPPA
ncbi:MAG: DNA primase [Phycisphaerales bacterium JB065]